MRRGLGLALVHRIVLRAGGRIHVSPGPGARFDVYLPVPAAGGNPPALSVSIAGRLR
jgi:two-component system CitB family sensor kinase